MRLIAALSFTALFATAAAAQDDSLAQYVPAETRLYVELTRAEDILLPLIEPQAWIILGELTGQPARLEESESWSRRVQQTIRLTPGDAIRQVFSQRLAFAAESWRQSYDAVLLGRPATAPRELIRPWPTKPLPSTGRASVYRLPNGVGLAVLDDIMIFGEQSSPRMFPATLRLVESDGGPRLSRDPTYRRLLDRVPYSPDGLVFARLAPSPEPSAPAEAMTQPTTTTTASATQDTPWRLPGPLSDSGNVLLAMRRDGAALHFSAIGDANIPPALPKPPIADLLRLLPRTTLAAWAGHVDLRGVSELQSRLPARHILRVAYESHARTGTVARLLDAVDGRVCVALGAVERARVDDFSTPPTPALALILALDDVEQAREAWRLLLHTTLSVYKLLALRGSTPGPAPIDVSQLPEFGIEQVNLSGPLVSLWGPAAADTLHLSWVIEDNCLIIATHTTWLKEILAARRTLVARLIDEPLYTAELRRVPRDSVFLARTDAISELGAHWLEYLERVAPSILSPEWWRQNQPKDEGVRLGVDVVADSEGRRLLVQAVQPNTPAEGAIIAGDAIVGVNRMRFTTTQPVVEILRGVAERPDSRWVDLLIERERIVRVRRLVLPFVDPIAVLQRVVTLGQIIRHVAYAESASHDDGPRGYLLLELRHPPAAGAAPQATRPTAP